MSETEFDSGVEDSAAAAAVGTVGFAVQSAVEDLLLWSGGHSC